MKEKIKPKRLKKQLKLLDVYAIATGTTLSAGFFLLPGIAAQQAGSAVVIAYMIAVIPLIPGIFSIVELTTAMPKAGGMYFSLDRAMGPIFGTIGGVGTWLSLIFKVSFTLIGMGAYIVVYMPYLNIKLVAVILAFILGVINILGAKKSSVFQIVLVMIILVILAIFLFSGMSNVNIDNFSGLFDVQTTAIFSTAGMVYVSYVGVAKVAGLSEEIKDPGRNLTIGSFLAVATTITIYGLGTIVMVGVLPLEILKNSLTPVADVARIIFGEWGAILMTVCAILAFVSVANAGTMSASRYPYAMSRDNIMPRSFKQISGFGTPALSIITTAAVIILSIIAFAPDKIAKLGSAFQLILNGLICLAVIIMRESRIESYDPNFKSPFYPWMQIIGILGSFYLIAVMGIFSILFSVGLVLVGFLWYWFYVKDKVIRTGAIYHIFERLGRSARKDLDFELRGILKEKGIRDEDSFEEIVTRSWVIDIDKEMIFEEVTDKVSELLSQSIDLSRDEIKEQFEEGRKVGATPVIGTVALPHFKTEFIKQTELVLVRSKNGIVVYCDHSVIPTKELGSYTVYALFFLVSPDDNPTQHLRILANIAGRVDEDNFMEEWFNAVNEQELKETLLHDERFISFLISRNSKSDVFIDSMLRNIFTPVGCLIAMLNRKGMTIIPNGNTVIEEGDRLTVIGDKKGLNEFRKRYLDE
jgi:basic amino acid/polyamine antiporter, APA family